MRRLKVLTARACRLAPTRLPRAPDEAIALTPNGRIVWSGSEIARLERGETALKPRIQLFADEHLAGSDRERVLKRLEAWLDAELDGKLEPLMVLSEASDLSGLARGLAYQLTENLGVLRREAASAEIKALDQAARAPACANTACASAPSTSISRRCSSPPRPISCCCCGRSIPVASTASRRMRCRARPQQGLTSVEAGNIPEPYWRAAGFHVAGTRAVRIDMLERLSDLIRARIAYRGRRRRRGPPTGATGDGGFRVVPELMSVVGCSGEEFCLDPESARLQARAAQARGRRGWRRGDSPTPSEAEAVQAASIAERRPKASTKYGGQASAGYAEARQRDAARA